MVIGLLWIVGIYGLGVLLVLGMHRRQRARGSIHVALLTLNNQAQIEWYLRSFLWISLLRGRTVCITVFDAGSTDETLAIATKLASMRDNIRVEPSIQRISSYMDEHKEDRVIVLQLMNRTAHDSWLIPYW